MDIPTWLIVAAIIAGIVAMTALTLIRGVLVDRTRARNKQLIMDHYGGLTGWPTEENEPARADGRAKRRAGDKDCSEGGNDK